MQFNSLIYLVNVYYAYYVPDRVLGVRDAQMAGTQAFLSSSLPHSELTVTVQG